MFVATKISAKSIFPAEALTKEAVSLAELNSQKTIFISESEKFETTENCIYENVIFDKRLAHSIAAILYRHDIQSVIIEGGAKTIQTFVDANLWDEACVFKGLIKFQDGTTAPTFSGNHFQRFDIKGDQLNIFRNYD